MILVRRKKIQTKIYQMERWMKKRLISSLRSNNRKRLRNMKSNLPNQWRSKWSNMNKIKVFKLGSLVMNVIIQSKVEAIGLIVWPVIISPFATSAIRRILNMRISSRELRFKKISTHLQTPPSWLHKVTCFVRSVENPSLILIREPIYAELITQMWIKRVLLNTGVKNAKIAPSTNISERSLKVFLDLLMVVIKKTKTWEEHLITLINYFKSTMT